MHPYFVLLLVFIAGFVIGVIVRDAMNGSSFMKYFGTPSQERLELNWSLRQFFMLFSNKAGKRWYESRQHLYRGVFVSLLCTFGLINLVRLEFGTSEDGRVSYVVFITHGFQSKQDMIKKLPVWINKYKHKAKDAQYFYQLFIAGHNVVLDWMTDHYT